MGGAQCLALGAGVARPRRAADRRAPRPGRPRPGGRSGRCCRFTSWRGRPVHEQVPALAVPRGADSPSAGGGGRLRCPSSPGPPPTPAEASTCRRSSTGWSSSTVARSPGAPASGGFGVVRDRQGRRRVGDRRRCTAAPSPSSNAAIRSASWLDGATCSPPSAANDDPSAGSGSPSTPRRQASVTTNGSSPSTVRTRHRARRAAPTTSCSRQRRRARSATRCSSP